MKIIKHIIKFIFRFVIESTKSFLPLRYRIRLANQFINDDFIVLKKSFLLKELEAKEFNETGKLNSIQIIISSLPCFRCEFLTDDWLWSNTYYPYYEKISYLLKPRSIFEIGALQGFSLIALLKGVENIDTVFWIDNESYLKKSNKMCYENIVFYFHTYTEEKELPIINYYKNHEEFLKSSFSLRKIDLIHIDGEHTYEGKLKDLNFCIKLKPKYILLDDYYYHSFNKEAINHWAKTIGYSFFVIDTFKRGLAFFDFSDDQDAYFKLKENGILIKETIKYK